MSRGEIIKGKSGLAFWEYTSWCHRYKVLEINGNVKYKKMKGFKTEDEAVESYKFYDEKFKAEMRKFYASVSKDIMFKDYIINWFNNVYSERIESNTKMAGAYIVFDLIIPSIEYDVKIDLITAEYLDEILQKANKITPSGGCSARAILSIAIKDAFIGKYISYNPMENVHKYKRPRPIIRVFSENQMKKFLVEASKTNWYLEILLGLFAGLRKGEIMGLKITDFDYENKTVSIQRQLVREAELIENSSKLKSLKLIEKYPKTSNSIRCLRIPNIILEQLDKRKNVINEYKEIYGDEYEDNNYISCQKNGKNHCLSSLNRVLLQICKKLSLPHITVHSLRHMCATILLEQGTSLAKISAFLGHTSIHTTFEYYCEVMDEKEKILAFMNEIFSVDGDE